MKVNQLKKSATLQALLLYRTQIKRSMSPPQARFFVNFRAPYKVFLVILKLCRYFFFRVLPVANVNFAFAGPQLCVLGFENLIRISNKFLLEIIIKNFEAKL